MRKAFEIVTTKLVFLCFKDKLEQEEWFHLFLDRPGQPVLFIILNI